MFERGFVFKSQCNGNLEVLNGLIEKCKKFNYLSRIDNFDISTWFSCGFSEIYHELCEFVGGLLRIDEESSKTKFE